MTWVKASRPMVSKPKSITSALILKIAVLIICVALALWYIYFRSTPGKTVDGFLNAIVRQDTTAINGFVSSASKKGSNEDVAAGISKMIVHKADPGRGANRVYRIGKVQVKGNTAMVAVQYQPNANFTFLGIKWVDNVIGLRREGQIWKVDDELTLTALKKGYSTE
jgi:hypothetical protein